MYNKEVMDIVFESAGIYNNTNDIEYVNEAEFRFLPKFKIDGVPKEILKELHKADSLLANEGIENKATASKILNIIFRIFDIVQNIYSVLYFPVLLIPIIGWVYYLLIRLWDWAYREGEEYFLKQHSLKIIQRLSKIEKESNSKEVKNKCKTIIDKLNKNINELDKK